MRAAFALMLLPAVAFATRARPGVSLDGAWSGTLAVAAHGPAGSASGALTQAGRTVTGSLTLDAGAAAGVFAVSGALRGVRVAVKGTFATRRLRWKARFDRRSQTWRGPLVVRGGGARTRAMLVLSRDGAAGPTCGGDYFASDVMPHVIEPICSQCHVPGGMAQAAPFKVTPGNATATARSAAHEIDPADPMHSKLIEKPRGIVPHGGGTRILAGSVEEQTLLHWIALVTAPGCSLGGGGGGGGGGGTGAELYAANCASCHGADARGLDGRPDIHCNRDVSSAVRNGRSGPAGDMQPFPNLGDADVAKIQSWLDGLCPGGGVTGAELYASNCATCHGADATGSATAPSVRCATRVADAMRVGRGAAMPSFPAISDPEVALVGAYLADLCNQAGRSGGDLYAGNCATCHGASATGGTNALGVAGPDIRCNRGIATPVSSGRGTDMPAFPALGAPDLARLQQYLTTTFCPVGSATGADLYASNCASCHGVDGAGTASGLNVRCATRVADAMQLGRGALMPAFPGVVASEASSIQSHLGAVCDALGRPGADLYVGNCSTCHGATAGGGRSGLGVHGPDIRCTAAGDYAEKVRFGDDDMPAFPALGTGDVTAIVDYVHAAFCAGG